jgi:hypothetical protein
VASSFQHWHISGVFRSKDARKERVQQIIMVLQQSQTASASATVDQIVEWMMRYTEFNDLEPLPKRRKSVLKLIIPIDPWMPEDLWKSLQK